MYICITFLAFSTYIQIHFICRDKGAFRDLPKNKGTIIEFNSQSPQAHGYNSTPVRTGYPGTQVSVNSVLIMPMNKIISSGLE